jgi:hypothetical protein
MPNESYKESTNITLHTGSMSYKETIQDTYFGCVRFTIKVLTKS